VLIGDAVNRSRSHLRGHSGNTESGYAVTGMSAWSRYVAHNGAVHVDYVENDPRSIVEERISFELHSLASLEMKMAAEPDPARRKRMKGSAKAIAETIEQLEKNL
jgi:hypothetical protein